MGCLRTIKSYCRIYRLFISLNFKFLKLRPHRFLRCGWPVCGKDCKTQGYHYLECPVLAKSSYKFSVKDIIDGTISYEAILPLRCSLLKGREDAKWNILMAMESHEELRREGELWQREQVND